MGFLPDRSIVVVTHILERQASEQPNKECVLFDSGENWTYAQALKESYRASNSFHKIGVKRGETVLVFLPNGPDWMRSWLGISGIGAIVVPVNPAFKGEMLRHVCQDSSSKYVIATPDLAENIHRLGLDLKIIPPDLLKEGPETRPGLKRPVEPWDSNAIVYTSGTTGPSKGVIIPHFHTYTCMICYLMRPGRLTKNDTVLIFSPFYHLAGMAHVVMTWSVGARLVIQSKFSGTRFLDVARETGSTVCCLIGVGEYLMKMPPQKDDADHPLRVLLLTPMVGDPPAFKARFGIEDLFIMFGMTEVPSVMVTEGELKDYGPFKNAKICGKTRKKPHALEVRLVDENDIPVPRRHAGELIVRSELPWSMNTGYWQRPEETARAWRNGWFHTGDLFECDEEGNYFFVDRKKDSIRRRGENVSSFEVEREVMTYPDVLEAACVAVPEQYRGDEIKVFVVPRDPETFDPKGLIEFLVPRMTYYMVPRYVEVVSELPKTEATMRIQKHKLREQGNTEATWDRKASGII